MVRLGGKRLSLHQVWDQDVVTALGSDSERIAADIVAHLTPQQKAQMETGTPADLSPEDWANESFALAEREIYAPLPASGRITLAPDYARRESGLARQQLTKAGLRLAVMLNRIFR
jgi:S1/P1 Nuclease